MRRKIITVLVVIVLAGTGGASWYLISDIKPTPEIKAQQTEISPISITIENGADKSGFEVQYAAEMTALEATKRSVGGKISTTGENEMAFVTAINGRKALPEAHEFWEFLVNGKQAEVGAGTYIVQPGDTIVWRLNSY